jgi:hypothetical protein
MAARLVVRRLALAAAFAAAGGPLIHAMLLPRRRETARL